MAFGIGTGLSGIASFFKSGAHVLAWDTVFGLVKDQFTEEVGKKAVNGIIANGSKWWGLDRSDDQLLLTIYGALYKHYNNPEGEYDKFREALDVLWAELLALPDNLATPGGRKTGKWAKRYRMTFVGIKIDETATFPKGDQKLKEKIPLLHKKTGFPVLGPDDQPLYHEKYEGGTEFLALSAQDPRVRHLYLTAKMAREELDTWNGGLRRAGTPELHNTINHLMVTYLQDDPFFKLMGEKWRAVVEWVEGRNLLTQGSAWAWLTADERNRIEAIPGLSEADKTALRKEQVKIAKGNFQDDLRKVKEEPLWHIWLRHWKAVLVIVILVTINCAYIFG